MQPNSSLQHLITCSSGQVSTTAYVAITYLAGAPHSKRRKLETSALSTRVLCGQDALPPTHPASASCTGGVISASRSGLPRRPGALAPAALQQRRCCVSHVDWPRTAKNKGHFPTFPCLQHPCSVTFPQVWLDFLPWADQLFAPALPLHLSYPPPSSPRPTHPLPSQVLSSFTFLPLSLFSPRPPS